MNKAKANSAPRTGGPRTALGKLRSAMNAVKHGLAGGGILVPGELSESYETRADLFFDSMNPRSDAEAEIVALAVDDIWKLERLRRIEHALLLGQIDELVNSSREGQEANNVSACILTLGRAIEDWQSALHEHHVRAAGALGGAVMSVCERLPALPVALRSAFDQALGSFDRTSIPVGEFAKARDRLLQPALVIMGELLKLGDACARNVDAVARAAAAVAVLESPEIARLAKYRQMLELGLQRRLTALQTMRDVVNRTTGQPDSEHREYRMKLRIVR